MRVFTQQYCEISYSSLDFGTTGGRCHAKYSTLRRVVKRYRPPHSRRRMPIATPLVPSHVQTGSVPTHSLGRSNVHAFLRRRATLHIAKISCLAAEFTVTGVSMALLLEARRCSTVRPLSYFEGRRSAGVRASRNLPPADIRRSALFRTSQLVW
ncbi:hypothetical protein OH77DRAFT_1423075 [Trametes cingulata]|nr:hypothetical protein OH77DRAFT_1423075 [Trametes cingulata]